MYSLMKLKSLSIRKCSFFHFVLFAVVDKIVARRTFELEGCPLTAERCYTSLTEETDPDDNDEESKFQSSTIEVKGVKKETSDEIVKMFFTSSSKSGGGKIDSIWHHKHDGKYIITFSERACE